MAKTRTRSSMMCVIYCRQSVTRQGEDSVRLAMQEDILRDLAASKGLAISEPPLHDPDTKVWKEEENRQGLKQLMERCRAGSISHVLAFELSRLARSVRIQENIIHELSHLGVEVHSCREPNSSDPLYRQILGRDCRAANQDDLRFHDQRDPAEDTATRPLGTATIRVRERWRLEPPTPLPCLNLIAFT